MSVRNWAGMAMLTLAVGAAWTNQPAHAEARCPQSSQSVVLFDGEEVDPQGDKRRLTTVAERGKASGLCVVAHVDSTGDPTYTRRMAVKRAMYVVDELAGMGVPRDRIAVEMRNIEGNVRKATDRRIEVVVGR